jgi:ABC-2 type transport system ATP-binding protein
VDRLSAALTAAGMRVEPAGAGALHVVGAGSREVGRVAARADVALDELTPQQATLEEAFMEITRDAVEFAASGSAGGVATTAGGVR